MKVFGMVLFYSQIVERETNRQKANTLQTNKKKTKQTNEQKTARPLQTVTSLIDKQQERYRLHSENVTNVKKKKKNTTNNNKTNSETVTDSKNVTERQRERYI